MKKIENIMNFYLLATDLKYRIRAGWDKNHWNVNSERLESIAEHVYGTCILAISISSEFDLDIDMNKVLKMLTIHEIGEVIIGDITPYDNISSVEKETIEHKAIKEMVKDLEDGDELYRLFLEFDAHETNESKFAYLCDKIEADIQSKVYQDKGCQRNLDDQEGNVVYGSPKILKLIENGARTVFDIWYETDKDKFEKDPIFKEIIEYVRSNSTDITETKSILKEKVGL